MATPTPWRPSMPGFFTVYPQQSSTLRALLATLLLSSTIGSASCVPRYGRGPVPIDLARTEVAVSHVPSDSPARVIATIRRGSASDPSGQEGRAWLALQSTASEHDIVRVTRQTATLHHTCVQSLDACSGHVVQALIGKGSEEGLAAALTEAHHALKTPDRRDPRWVAAEALRALIFEGHPFGHPVEGRDGTINTMDAHHLRQFFEGQVVRSTVEIQATGSWTTSGLATLSQELKQISSSMPNDATMMAPVPLRHSELYILSSQAEPAALAVGRAWRDHPQLDALKQAIDEQGLDLQPPMTTDPVHGSTIALTTTHNHDDLIDIAVALLSNPEVGPIQVVIVTHDAQALLKTFEDRAAPIVKADQRPRIVRVRSTQELFR
ncbi:MAG: hypothetical protein ACI9MC_002456 [Kiritimatiellia bacterium]|jgi:hypothetical protein